MAMQAEGKLSSVWRREETQDPEGSLDQKYWKKIFIGACMCAVIVDPLFLYVPILKDDIKCLMLDPKLKSENYSGLIVELKYGQDRMDFSFVLKRCVPKIAKTIWASNDILIDIVALLPLTQMAILIFFSKMSDLRSLTTTRMVLMNVFALLQYMPRILRIYLSSMELKRTLEEEIVETPIWIKGVLNFSMYIIASHVVGAMWYFFAIQRMMICWHSACRKVVGCDNKIFGCHDHHLFRNTTNLNDLCPVNVSDNSSDTMLFDFGIYVTVLQYGVVGSTNYFQKFSNCFWWGLRNLSSLGSNLEPSVNGWENLYTIFISITGLLLFLYLIGNLQMYMQIESTRTQNRMQIKRKMKGKDEEIELWLFKKGIPTRFIKDFKLQILEKVKQALQEDTYTNLDNILPLLPSDVQRRIEEHFAKLKQVPMLRGMDEGLLKIIYQKLEPVRYTENNFIIRKGERFEKMVCIVHGFVSIEETSSDDSSLGASAGELCGEELLRWLFYSYFPSKQPLATESLKTNGVVEALALTAHDLKSIYGQSDIQRREKPRHRKMMQEEVEQRMNSWIHKNGIPEKMNKDIKSRIMNNLSFDYWDTLPSDWYDLVSCLPSDFQNEIERYMPLTKLKEMPVFQNMEESVLKQICSHLQPMKYYDGDHIISKGDPIQLLFIVDGHISDQGFNQKDPGEFYGEELLVWPFSTSFPYGEPTAAESPYVVYECTEVLVLTAMYMKSVATEFRKHFIKNYHTLRRRVPTISEELIKEATRNYTCSNYPNEGGYGTVYHPELIGIAVAIKTCNSATGDPFIQSQRLVHEAFVLSEIHHKNVEKLLGCCLETRWPKMVYERTNALTLVEHFHRNKLELSLESRMKIAAETAGALAHVHSRSVIHRDVKTTNILIDRTTHTVEVTGFGASRLLDEDEVSTLPGTSRYLDHKYLKSHDVYSFGVVLVELLTHQEAVSSNGSQTSLANDFVCSLQEDRLGQILDGEINTDEFSFEMAEKVSMLAVTCLRSREEERPSMEEVAAELEGVVQTIINRAGPSTVDDNISSTSRTSE